jgi:phage terminase small subunit
MANGDKSKIGERQLTPRQVAFAEHLLESDTITEAARKAGYSDKNLSQSGHQHSRPSD